MGPAWDSSSCCARDIRSPESRRMDLSDIRRLDPKTGKKQKLRLCQKRGIKWCLGFDPDTFKPRRCSALFMDMGLGKTGVVLTVIAALHEIYEDFVGSKGDMKPVLVVGPIRVIYSVWAQEAASWSHTRKMSFSIVHGSAKVRMEALDTKADVYLINPENLRWLLRVCKKQKRNWPFSMLVIDESSMFKSVGSKRFRMLRHYVKYFKRRIIMTGTPRPNSLMELWPQIYILDEGARLGSTYKNFKIRFFAPENEYVDYPTYVPRPGSEEYIHNLISDVALSMEAKDWLDFPPTIHNRIDVDLPARARELYNRFEKEMFLQLERGDVDALTAGAVSMRCWQMANGSIYTVDRSSGDRIWEETHQAKLDAVEEVIEETGSPVLVAYWFKPDIIRLRRRYPKAPVLGKQKNNRLEKEWNDGKHPVMFCHYRSAAHGMNLQLGPGHTIALFSLTWSYELWDQLISRIGGARAQRPVTVHSIVSRNTTDEAMLLRVTGKEKGNRATLNALNQYRRRKHVNERIRQVDVSDIL